MTKLMPYWRTENEWVCLNHIPSIKHHRSIATCTMSNCSCVRPKLIKESVISNIIEKASKRCSYYRCSKDRLEGKKYCSDKCRKDRARELYRIRKKLKEKKEEERKETILELERRLKLLKRG